MITKHFTLLLLICLACAQSTVFSNNDFKSQVLTFKKADKIIVIKPNQYIYK